MNTTSVEISKELYDLSGWKHTSFYWQRDFYGDGSSLWNLYSDHEVKTSTTVPAYDLEYLLMHLPAGSYISKRKTGATASTGNGWQNIRPYTLFTVRGDTPSNACANLLIELFKQGILN